MDRMGMFWGGMFGFIWGQIYDVMQFPMAKEIVEYIDKGLVFCTGVKMTQVMGSNWILALLFMGLLAVIGGYLGTGRTEY